MLHSLTSVLISLRRHTHTPEQTDMTTSYAAADRALAAAVK
jgi:hypothetical protein